MHIVYKALVNQNYGGRLKEKPKKKNYSMEIKNEQKCAQYGKLVDSFGKVKSKAKQSKRKSVCTQQARRIQRT